MGISKNLCRLSTAHLYPSYRPKILWNTPVCLQGVHDAIKKCETAMADYEEKLGLLKQQEAYLAELKELSL